MAIMHRLSSYEPLLLLCAISFVAAVIGGLF
jgi:hypothetical protein